MKQLTKTRTKRKGLWTLQINKRRTMYSSDNSCDILIIFNLNAINVIFCQWWSLSGFVCLILKKIIKNIFSWNCNWNRFYTFFLFQQFLPVQFYTNLHKDLFCWENAVIQHFCRVPLICRRHIHSTAFLGAWIPNIFGRKTSLTANLYCCFWKILI